MRVLSMGAGIQTTALLLIDKFDLVIFADTGSEKQETYPYIENFLKPYCKETNQKWITVKNQKYDSLQEMCEDRNYPPDYKHRVCTKEFKIVPIQKYMRSLGFGKGKPYTLVMGISYDEAHRANFTPRVSYELREFPLVDRKITRRQCENIIKDHGWELPVKSGCDFCPFHTVKDIRQLAYNHPKRFDELVEIEKNFHNGQTWNARGKTFTRLAQTDTLDEFMENDTCETGHCFV